jgi:PAS domain S-box-containing protein
MWYLLLSRSTPPWTAEEGTALRRIAGIIAPIIAAREVKQQKLSGLRKRQPSLLLQERRLTDLTDSSPEMIYTTGKNDTITSINAAGVELLGYGSPEELVGCRFSELTLNPEDRAGLLQRLDHTQRIANFEIILLQKNGNPIYCLESVSVMKNQAGRFIGLQGVVRNISERIEIERELWKSNLELANLNQKLELTQAMMVQQEKLASIGQLAAGVAHEINNPLGFLKSNFETTALIIEEFRQYLESARTTGKAMLDVHGAETYFMKAFDDLMDIFRESEDGFKRIIRIVRDLKSFSRIDQEDTVIDIDLNNEFESTLGIVWNELKYVAEVHTTLGNIPIIKGHSGELGQVILNILINAAQAIDSQKRPEKGNIEVHTLKVGKFVRLSIQDDGPGIPKEVQSRIFDPFFTTKEPGKGTGLGLSISYDIIVNRYGGHLDMVSEPGSGTIFTIDLPIQYVK